MMLEIDGEHAGIKFSACHFIPKHEKCARLHGHSYVMRLKLEGDIGNDGMIMDFTLLKKELKKIADELDHRTILPGKSDNVVLTVGSESVDATCGNKKYTFPREDVVILEIPNITAEEMTKMMIRRIINEIDFSSNVRSVSIGLDEERGQTAWCTHEL
ncbi:MAG: 6-pyruvoyl tetrahydropterin synthase family protein [archaeon]|nr:6-pyruvoyl tetrahydropterin synthase family protein [archaeon]